MSASYTVTLSGGGWAALRDMCGHDENSVAGTDTLAAVQLLNRLLVALPGTAAAPGAAADLPTPDRDRVLAGVYLRVYGRRLQSSPVCRQCGERFDMSFDLTDLLASVQPDYSQARPAGNGVYELADGARFRLPTGADELALFSVPPEHARSALLERCLLEGRVDDPALIEDAMSAVGPVLDLDLTAHCPECGTEQTVHFDMQSFLLGSLRAEQPLIASEIHRLARAYGWGLNDILGLTRQQRRTYVSLIELEASRASLRRSAF